MCHIVAVRVVAVVLPDRGEPRMSVRACGGGGGGIWLSGVSAETMMMMMMNVVAVLLLRRSRRASVGSEQTHRRQPSAPLRKRARQLGVCHHHH